MLPRAPNPLQVFRRRGPCIVTRPHIDSSRHLGGSLRRHGGFLHPGYHATALFSKICAEHYCPPFVKGGEPFVASVVPVGAVSTI